MRVILGVTGCIAAYKSAVILRLLQKQGCEILPVMTASAQRFLSALTLEKLSGNKVVNDLFQDQTTAIEHIALARRSDLLIVAPATANSIAKFAHGIADDFLSTLYVSTVTPVIVAPAMNVEMWRHPATRENIEILERRGVVVVEPGSGYLACGEVGEGRLAEPEEIAEAALSLIRKKQTLQGKSVLVTAGPTVEDLDPVRFISNRSSGKMGYAVAREAQLRGADVTLVSGPVSIPAPAGVRLVPTRSAADMASAVFELYPASNIVVMAAAVADFTPESVSGRKIKKENRPDQIRLSATQDILLELGRAKSGQFLVGFAAESEALLENARQKLHKKNLDLIVANDISKTDLGFQSDRNQVTLLDAAGGEETSEILTKSRIAEFIWDRIESRLSPIVISE